MPAPSSHRFAELDLLRTVAIVGMVLYHLLYDLVTFYQWDIPILEGEWKLFARIVAILFLLLVGISFAISWGKHRPSRDRFAEAYTKYFYRSVGLLFCAMLITIATYWMHPQTYVRFGILHLIGMSILFLPFFAGARTWNLLFGFIIIVMGARLRAYEATTSLLLPLGIMQPKFVTVDYFPMFPWFGVVLIGYVLGWKLYVQGLLKKHLHYRSRWMEILLWPGRHALIVYLLHQPLILLTLGLLFGFDYLAG